MAVLVVGCKPDSGIQRINAFPEVTITSHQDGDEVWDGYAFMARASVSDSDHGPEELSGIWYVENQVVCDEATPEEDGTLTCEMVLDADESRISVEVRDAENATAFHEVGLSVTPTSAPTAMILAPEAGGQYYSDVKVTFQGVVDDVEDQPEDLVVFWESDQDGVLNDIDTSVDAGGEVLGFSNLAEGQHAISLFVEDTSGKPATASVVIDVGPPNSSPTCEILSPETGALSEEGATPSRSASICDFATRGPGPGALRHLSRKAV